MSANVWDIKYSPSKKLQIWNYIFDYHSRSQKKRCRPYKFLLKNSFLFFIKPITLTTTLRMITFLPQRNTTPFIYMCLDAGLTTFEVEKF